MPVIEVGTTGDVGILIAGIMVGAGMTVKMIKWIKEIAGARSGTAPKHQPSNNGRHYLTDDEHRKLCEAAGKATGDSLKEIQETIKEANRSRVQEVQRLFDKMDSNHDDLKDRLSKQGERIAKVETEVRLMRNGN